MKEFLMNISLKFGNILDDDADAVVLNLFEGVTAPGGATGAVDKALNGAISDLIAAGDFTGKAKQTAVLYPRGGVADRKSVV